MWNGKHDFINWSPVQNAAGFILKSEKEENLWRKVSLEVTEKDVGNGFK